MAGLRLVHNNPNHRRIVGDRAEIAPCVQPVVLWAAAPPVRPRSSAGTSSRICPPSVGEKTDDHGRMTHASRATKSATKGASSRQAASTAAKVPSPPRSIRAVQRQRSPGGAGRPMPNDQDRQSPRDSDTACGCRQPRHPAHDQAGHAVMDAHRRTDEDTLLCPQGVGAGHEIRLPGRSCSWAKPPVRHRHPPVAGVPRPGAPRC